MVRLKETFESASILVNAKAKERIALYKIDSESVNRMTVLLKLNIYLAWRLNAINLFKRC
jgi:hypothetical protein